ncbi:G3E family GTPase [Arthrobacter sp. V4I6]|uniref:GTP-binding protein n=1 Tax=unclassified Arthrobacter TaxID=235627 RepID=UPI00278ACB71|nr:MULTISPECIES: GTP-binding protein [unclassified Arthrobacter]MDQ0823629.1 G3E family GTPase [Arthrobacter sp. V1I7]MDQ0853263.1 G3E family GTPase [Arthrobacter sp. V4I6]
MHVTVVSSLDVFCRQQACAALAADSPGALVVFHDLLEGGLVIRRTFREGRRLEREESTLEHGCLSCTVRLDVVPTVGRLLDSGSRLILGLPPGVAAATAVHALLRGLGDSFTIDSVVLACAPDAVEDQIWDHHTLFESGFTAVPEDDRTPGEFLLGELSFSDTVVLADPALVPVDPAARARGVQLVKELAPHVVLTDSAGVFRPGRHNLAEATARTVPGSVRIPAESSPPFTTVVQRIERPLHPGRFRHALAALAEGSCWLRGRLWVASVPGCRIAVQGIGPRVWLENTGPWQADRKSLPLMSAVDGPDAALAWHPEFGDRGTVLAVTGDDVDAAEIAALLQACELTEAEMAPGAASFADPFDLNQSTETPLRSKS